MEESEFTSLHNNYNSKRKVCPVRVCSRRYTDRYICIQRVLSFHIPLHQCTFYKIMSHVYTTHYSCDSIFIRNEFTHTHIYPGHFTLTRVDKKMYFNYHGISWYYNGVQNTKYTYGTMMLIQLYSAPVLSLVTLQYGCT